MKDREPTLCADITEEEGDPAGNLVQREEAFLLASHRRSPDERADAMHFDFYAEINVL